MLSTRKVQEKSLCSVSLCRSLCRHFAILVRSLCVDPCAGSLCVIFALCRSLCRSLCVCGALCVPCLSLARVEFYMPPEAFLSSACEMALRSVAPEISERRRLSQSPCACPCACLVHSLWTPRALTGTINLTIHHYSGGLRPH